MIRQSHPAEDASEIRVELQERSGTALLGKRVVQACFGLLVIPRLCFYRLASLLVGRRAFGAASESIAKVPGMRGVFLRQSFYRRTLKQCGQDAYFGWNSVFSMPEATVGDRVYVGRFCSIGFAEIGAETMLADGVQILSGGHEHGGSGGERPHHDQDQSYQKVRVGPQSWIGAGAIVMADVGESAVVGAGAVVSKPIPAGTVAVGVPARVIKRVDG